MQAWLGALSEGLRFATEQAQDIPDGLIKMAGMTGEVFEAADAGFPILIEFWRQARLDPVIWERAIDPYKQYLNYFENLIIKGKHEGSIKNSVDPQIAARLLLSLAMGFLLQASFDPEDVSWQEATQSGMRLLLDGMRAH
jgi:hypothetical protein